MKIELQHIHKHFGPVHANNDITVTFGDGEIIGILGENGAGKSTLMKILSGFQPADSGQIWIDGQYVEYTGPEAAISHGIGMLQQDPLDVPAFTVVEDFTYGRPAGVLDGLVFRQGEARQLLEDINRRFGFEIDPDMTVAQLSIAQRQQLEIIRLLSLNVKTLILDEPTTGISAEQKATLFGALRELARRDGLTVLLVSHKLEDVITLCDRVVVLRDGRLVGEMEMPATTEQLVESMFGQALAPQSREQVALGEPVLKLVHVHLRNQRLDMPDINLDVRAGEVVGLAGLEGSGQELLMRACVGLERIERGSIIVNGEVVVDRVESMAKGGSLPRRLFALAQRAFGLGQVDRPYRYFMRRGVILGAAGRLEEGLIAGLTLTEHLALVMNRNRVIEWDDARQQTQQRIRDYNVIGQSEDNIEQLSGGNQQRMLVALLPANPVALILEQPTRGLDVDSARWIWRQLLERRKHSTAIVFSSVDLDELVTYSDRILVFYAGRIYEIADANQTTIDELGHLIGGEFDRMKPS